MKKKEWRVRIAMKYGWLLLVAGSVGLAACSGPTTPSPEDATAGPAADASQQVVSSGTPAASGEAATPAPAPRACMIAGTINVLGQSIRSRDCMQVRGATTEQELAQACEGLANAFASMGSEAGKVTYMDGCPAPSQGSCQNMFGGKFDGHYYERSPEDLGSLPHSCSAGGGTWTAG